jgi:hypothetical protein
MKNNLSMIYLEIERKALDLLYFPHIFLHS